MTTATPTREIDPVLLERFRNARIGHGKCSVGGGKGDDCLCIQQWLAVMSGEAPMSGTPTDTPKCVCPVINRFSMSINDRFGYGRAGDARRKSFFTEDIALGMLDTRSTPAVKAHRKQMLAAWVFGAALPDLLRRIDLPEHADRIAGGDRSLTSLRAASDAAWASKGYASYSNWRAELRKKVRSAVEAELKKRGAAVDVAAAVAAAAAVDVAAAAAADVAADVAAAVAADVDVAAAVAADVAAAVAVDVAADVAVAAAADVAADLSSLPYGSDEYWKVRNAAYDAAYSTFRAKFEQHPAFEVSLQLEAAAQQLMRDLCAVTPDTVEVS